MSGESKTDDATYGKCIELFRYIAASEENQKLASNSFCKDMDSNLPLQEEYEVNHFSRGDNQGGDLKVLTTSYELLHVAKELGWDDTIHTGDQVEWLKIPCPRMSSNPVPVVTAETDKNVRDYLEHIQNHPSNADRFRVCKDLVGDTSLNEMLPLLTAADIPEKEKEGEGWDEIRAFVSSALAHSNSEISKKIVPLYKELHSFVNTMETKTELVMGLDHVRLVYDNVKKGDDEPQQRIVNGPLLEVPMQVELDPESDDLWIRPAEGAKVSLNVEVMAGIIAAGGGNRYYVEKLYRLAETCDVDSISLKNPRSYEKFRLTARDLSCRGQVKSQQDRDAHRFDDVSAMVINDAWCLEKRSKKSTPHSIDARNLMQAYKQKRIEVSPPLRTLLEGPKLKTCLDASYPGEGDKDTLIFPKPASASQRLAAESLLLKSEPLFILDGPPGTGKTHSIVNFASTCLSMDMSVLLTSSNPRALRAFIEMLPPQLQGLALDMSCLELGDIHAFQKALDVLCKKLLKIQESDKRKEHLNKLYNAIASKKNKLHTLKSAIEQGSKAKRVVMENEELKDTLELVFALSRKASWFLKMILDECLELDGSTPIIGLIEKIQHAKAVSFGSAWDSTKLAEQKYDELISLVRVKAEEDVPTSATSSFRLHSDMTQGEKNLSMVKIGGKAPSSQADWQHVLAAAEFRHACDEPLGMIGLDESEFYSEAGPSFLCDDFCTMLKDGLKLTVAAGSLNEELKKLLATAVLGSRPGREAQEDCRRLETEIQELEAVLLFEKVVASLQSKLDGSSMSKLTQLNLLVAKLKNSSVAKAETPTERSSRHLKEFINKFKETAPFMPFLIVTLEQVSAYLPANHQFDIGIIDETSQSGCTALNFVSRCKKLLAVGDDKQVSPSQVALSEERIRSLRTMLPRFPTKDQLLPEYSALDLFKSSFPSSSALLTDHYRSIPEIIDVSNALFYYDELNPLRLAGGPKAITDNLLKGKIEKGKNHVEAAALVDDICDRIKSTAETETFQTIGVISMGGSSQCKLILKLMEEKLEPIREEYGNEVVDRHKILVGTPKEFQGDERHSVYYSFVYSASVGRKGNRLKLQVESADSRKSWNVALTRARDEMIVYRSYSIKDLKTADLRQQILRKLSQPWKGHKDKKALIIEAFPLVDKIELAVSDALKGKGYRVEKNLARVWNGALCIDGAALICLENFGESQREWEATVDQQKSLQGAGRACLRVDCLELLLDFNHTLEDVSGFLQGNGFFVGGVAKKARLE